MKAKKKPLDEKTAADYGVDVSPRLTVVKTSEMQSGDLGILCSFGAGYSIGSVVLQKR